MALETITGTLKRRKVRRAQRNLISDYFRMMAEEAGVVEPRYYKEDGFVTGDTLNTIGNPNVWSLASLKAFGDIPSGTRVRFRASVSRWDNGNGHSLGGTLTRVRDVEVLAPPALEAKGN